MKKLITAIFVCFTLLFASVSHAALDPKLKMIGTMAGYGVVGGALLGTASMALGLVEDRLQKGHHLDFMVGSFLELILF